MSPEERLISSMHQPSEWSGEERRKHTRSELFDTIASINEKLEHTVTKLDDHILLSAEWRDQMSAKILGEQSILDAFESAFPEGDAHSHRAYHESVIKYIERREKLVSAIIEKSLAGLVWAALMAIGAGMWSYVQTKLGVK